MPKKKLMADIPNPNQVLADAYIRHQMYLLRYSRGLTGSLWNLLNDTERDLKLLILESDVSSEYIRTPSGRKSLDRILEEISAIRGDSWIKVNSELESQLFITGKYEESFYQNALISAAPVVLSPKLPTVTMLSSIINSMPFEGRLLTEWSDKLKEDDLARFKAQLQIGLTSGETNQQLVTRLFGTVRLNKEDGVLFQTRGQLGAIVNTAVAHVANNYRNEFALANSDIFSEEEFDATLDGRTTPLCRSLDKKVYRVGQGPKPPLHIRCRSIRRPKFNSEYIGNRPAKPVTDRLLLSEFSSKEGLDKIKSRADLPYGMKTQYDEWARARIRQLAGPVSGDLSYEKWLRTQSTQFQDDVLGITKGKLFRDGGLSLDKFVHRNGDEVTISELVTLERQAFQAAGLDVSRWLN